MPIYWKYSMDSIRIKKKSSYRYKVNNRLMFSRNFFNVCAIDRKKSRESMREREGGKKETSRPPATLRRRNFY